MNETKKRCESESKLATKYKEYFERAQLQYKTLETEKLKTINEKDKKIKEVTVLKIESEEKYERILRHKKVFEDKERILLNTFDAS